MQTDILIIGSGPVGATYARVLYDAKPNVKITMIDLGPRLTEKAGQHVKNIADPIEMETAQIKSQGSEQILYPPISVHQRAAAVQRGELSPDILARAGTHLFTPNPEDLAKNQMPAAAASSNVGGMGSHWTCACPSPGNEERIPFIPENEMNEALEKARNILHVTQKAFPLSPEGLTIINTLQSVFSHKSSIGREVQPMPLACRVDENGERYWTGTDLVLPPQNETNFELRSETICRKLIHQNGLITGAVCQHLPSGKTVEIKAKIVIVAADTMRTPQLLWASGIRPKALGHYLNEHPFIFAVVELKKELVEQTRKNQLDITEKYNPNVRKEPTIGVFWVPFDAPNHRFHGQIMHMDLSPMDMLGSSNPNESKHIVGLGWGCLKETQFEDCIEFSETEKDYLGMPKMNFKFHYTKNDKKAMADAKSMQKKAAEAFGKILNEGEQTIMPAGTSLHYEGSVRMGITNDSTSVCDSYSKVWDFENLFVGGNGVIPTATASNPTLTSVALAIRACDDILKKL